jgi:hypothetical protein
MKKYNTQFIKYSEASPHYIEVFVNLKRTVRIKATTEKKAIERALKKEETKTWSNLGYKFVDCDYNIGNEKDYKSYRE